MWEPFTDKARRAIVDAQEYAQALGNNYMGTEHLLLGTVKNSEIVKTLLNSLQPEFKTEKLIDEILYICGHGSQTTQDGMVFTPRAKVVIENSFNEARKLNHNYISCEHIFLGLLLEGEGVASRVLHNLGFDSEVLYQKVASFIKSPPKKKVSPTITLKTKDGKDLMLTKCDQTCNLLLEIGDLTNQACGYILPEEVRKLREFLKENYE